MHDTLPLLEQTRFPAIRRRSIATLQVNLGYLCNQSCVHCHVNAGPHRTELMNRETAGQVLGLLRASGAQVLDLTGGAPELNPVFREIVGDARQAGARVIDRCNLTVLLEPGQETLAEFLAANQVEITASLPCYSADNVDRQRGKGVFERSIRALRQLNALGYGRELVLNLVYNPQGPSLPPPQQALEADYRRRLAEDFGIVFTALYTLANMPIQRFGSMLVSKGQFEDYMALLRAAHRPANLDSVMCRDLLSIDWQGWVYDCDFNQMLGLPLRQGGRGRTHVSDLLRAAVAADAASRVGDPLLAGNPVVIRDHCFGCTAGQGSSCGGALA